MGPFVVRPRGMGCLLVRQCAIKEFEGAHTGESLGNFEVATVREYDL
jgi:hypothetical protein